MEIAPVPHRSSRGERRRLVLGLLLLVPVVLLVLLPPVLGLDRYVVTDRAMSGSLGRGAVVMAREVPAGDLRVGDVIRFEPPGAPGRERVTRRIVAIQDGVATTRGDARDADDPWRLRLAEPTYPRVWVGVPWVGYPFVLDGRWVLLAVAAGALGLGLLSGRPRATRASRPDRARAPVG